MTRELKVSQFDFLYDIENEGYFSKSSGSGFGDCTFIKTVTITGVSTVDENGTIPVQFYWSRNGSHYPTTPYNDDVQVFSVGINESITIAFNKLLFNTETLTFSKGNDDTNVNHSIRVFVNSIKLLGDGKYSKEQVLYCLGDSIANPSAFVNRVNGHMNCQVKLEINEAGGDYRIVHVSDQSQTSTAFVNRLKANNYIIRRADVIMIAYGVNDVGLGVTDEQWISNINYIIKWKKQNYQNSKLIFVSPSPINDDTNYNRCKALHALTKTTINGIAKVYDIDISEAFTDRSIGMYLTDLVHLNQNGHDACASVLAPQLKNILGLT